MKKIILEIEFDDTDCYTGKYDNIPETIKNLVEFEMYHCLESDYSIILSAALNCVFQINTKPQRHKIRAFIK